MQMHRLIDSLDSVGISPGVIGDVEARPHTDMLGLPVEVTEIYRAVHRLGNLVITHLPFPDRLARSLGRHAEMEFSFRLLHLSKDAAHHGGPVATVHRNASHLAKDRSERPFEEFLLDHNMRGVAYSGIEEIGHEEVSKTSMGHAQDNALLLMSGATVYRPSETFEKPGTEFLPHRLKDNRLRRDALVPTVVSHCNHPFVLVSLVFLRDGKIMVTCHSHDVLAVLYIHLSELREAVNHEESGLLHRVVSLDRLPAEHLAALVSAE